MAMRKLHPAARWLFFIQNLVVGIPFVFIVVLSLFPLFEFLFLYATGSTEPSGFILVSIILIILSVVIFIFSLVWSKLTYNNWGYEFRKDGLYLQRGVIWKRYSSIPYERVQNVDIHRGILARIFGFSSLMVQTAGYSYGGRHGGMGAEGAIPAVDVHEAERIREWLLKVMRGKRQGL